MNKQTKILLSSGFAGLILVTSLFIWNRFALGGVVKNELASKDVFQNFTFFASSTAQINLGLNTGTTTNATSTNITPYFDTSNFKDNGYFVVKGAKQITLYLSRDDATPTTGTSTFNIQVSPDGITWVDYNKLIGNATNTNVQTPIRSQYVNWAGWNYNFANNGTTTVALDTNDAIFAIRCIVNFVTDGNSYCTATASW